MSTIAQGTDVLPAGTWRVDPVHSQVGFALEYMVGTFRGAFSPVEATLEIGEDGQGTLSGTVRAEHVRVQDENLSIHLQSPDFFDAEQTPLLSFHSDEIAREGDDVVVHGSLSVKGATQPVELRGSSTDPIRDPFGSERFALTLAGSVDRTRFGLDWNAELPNGEPALASDVELTAELSLVKA